MKCQFTFHHVDISVALREYTQEQLDHVERVKLRDSRCQVHYSKGRYDCHVELIVSGPWGHCKATGESDDFYKAVDVATEKLSRQFHKKKDQMRDKKSQPSHNTPYFRKPA